MNQSAFHKLSYGVYICSTWDNGRPTGCVANSAMQITSSPASVAVSINRNNYTHDCIADCGYFAITVLSEKTQPLLIGKFGFSSGREKDKFDGVSYSVRGKLPVPDGGCAYIVCKVTGKMETSTHTVFLGEVLDADILSDEEPMTYAYYHKVVKGKAPKNAPTYIEENTEKARFVCDTCGYEYDGEVPFENLPEDWVCPVCNMGKEHFSKK